VNPAELDSTLMTRESPTAAVPARDWPLLDDVELGARVADLFTRVA
jgi:hypothetical protein